MATRSDIRTRTRDILYEDTADLFTDDQLNRCITDTINDLPRKGVYLEQLWYRDLVENQLNYTLPDNTLEVEKVELNYGTSSRPKWKLYRGCDFYDGALFLPTLPTYTYTIRVHIRKKFSELTDDDTATDIPDDKLRLVAYGAALKAYEMLGGFFLHNKNWDSQAKPYATDMNKVANWIQLAQTRYEKLLSKYRTYPRPREINLVD